MGKIGAFGGLLWLSGMACGAASKDADNYIAPLIAGVFLGVMAVIMYRRDLRKIDE